MGYILPVDQLALITYERLAIIILGGIIFKNSKVLNKDMFVKIESERGNHLNKHIHLKKVKCIWKLHLHSSAQTLGLYLQIFVAEKNLFSSEDQIVGLQHVILPSTHN